MRKIAAGLKIIAGPVLTILLILVLFLSFQDDMTKGLKSQAFAIMGDHAENQLSIIQTRLENAYEQLEIVAIRAADENGLWQGRSRVMALMKTMVSETDFHNIAIARSNGDAELTNGSLTNVADRK